MSNVFLNSINQKINPKSTDVEPSSNLSHSSKEELNHNYNSNVQEGSVDESNHAENHTINSNLQKGNENANE